MKLGLLPGPAVPTFSDLLSHCLASLHRLEKDVVLPAFPVALRTSSQSRHTSYTLREGGTMGPHELWGEVVVILWRASMTSGSPGEAWDELTPRILVWNAMVGGEDHVAEWARCEAVFNAKSQTA
jgi:hypothetical protein